MRPWCRSQKLKPVIKPADKLMASQQEIAVAEIFTLVVKLTTCVSTKKGPKAPSCSALKLCSVSARSCTGSTA